jgi:hypothetical protein
MKIVADPNIPGVREAELLLVRSVTPVNAALL